MTIIIINTRVCYCRAEPVVASGPEETRKWACVCARDNGRNRDGSNRPHRLLLSRVLSVKKLFGVTYFRTFFFFFLTFPPRASRALNQPDGNQPSKPTARLYAIPREIKNRIKAGPTGVWEKNRFLSTPSSGRPTITVVRKREEFSLHQFQPAFFFFHPFAHARPPTPPPRRHRDSYIFSAAAFGFDFVQRDFFGFFFSV